MEKIQQLI